MNTKLIWTTLITLMKTQMFLNLNLAFLKTINKFDNIVFIMNFEHDINVIKLRSRIK